MTIPSSHRATARVLLRNGIGSVFLLLTDFDPEVQLPARWITPGGAIEPGESIVDAAIRELFEETGIEVSASDLGEQLVSFEGKWLWGDQKNFHTYTDNFFELVVDDFELDSSGWTDDERRDVHDYRWWSIDELRSSQELISPPGLVAWLKRR